MLRWMSFIGLLIVSSTAHAYRVEPMIAEMEPIGKRAQMTMRIDNTSSKPLTVELYPLAMTMDQYGNETISPADDDLLVIPVTAIVKPGRSQSVMVRYLGDPSISQSKSYRVAVKQVKVENSKEESGQMGLLLQFNTLVNIRPKNTNPKLSIRSVTQKDAKWLVEVENSGDSYGRLSRTNWTLDDGNNSLYLKGVEISKLIAGTLVLPYSTRFFEMTPIDNFNVRKLKIDIAEEE
ncbi:molecular chaperone [Vibrio sinaloensis]|uniref:Pilus assembly protein n=1 Tax=Photobacterium sp. (strain ATCC 43367) TaxID=379097 RepID=A0A0A5JN99_PHOS4|nr:molecular chaperone [Vibrio sinaloensis]KGY09408.1 pilus assembly protein [Vibrio sinaloensis]